MNSMIDILNEFRMVQSGDDWGDHMDALFSACAIMYIAGEEIPDYWEYYPGAMGRPEISEAHDYLRDYEIEHVVVFAHYLHHIKELLESNDLDY